jgi:hypothetical protein
MSPAYRLHLDVFQSPYPIRRLSRLLSLNLLVESWEVEDGHYFLQEHGPLWIYDLVLSRNILLAMLELGHKRKKRKD